MEDLELESFDWDAEMVLELVPLAQSAPPRASPEYEEIPAIPYLQEEPFPYFTSFE